MSFRLALVAESFDFSPLDQRVVFMSVRSVLEHLLYHQTHLLYNRHADQIMLSALYGFCKVLKLDKVNYWE
jgi:retinoblastoma-like protein 1